MCYFAKEEVKCGVQAGRLHTQVRQAHSRMSVEPFGRAASLLAMFDPNQQDRTVTDEELAGVLQQVAQEHNLVGLDHEKVANNLAKESFLTLQTIAGIDMDNLKATGVGRAHAKVLVRYLGGRNALTQGKDPAHGGVGQTSPGVTLSQDSMHESTVMATALAGALEGTKDVVKLAQSEPTVFAVREWIRRHIIQASKVAPCLVPILKSIKAGPN